MKCPICSHGLAHLDLKEGNFVVCYSCTHVLYFSKDGILVSPPREALDKLSMEQQAEISYKRRLALNNIGGVVFIKQETNAPSNKAITIITTDKPKEDGIIVHHTCEREEIGSILSKIKKRL